MLKERLAAVHAVRDTFIPAQESAEQVAIDTTRSIVEFMEQRRLANLPVATGADALELMAEAGLFAVQSHVRMAKARAALRSIPETIGVKAFGADDFCEPNKPFTSAELRLVG